MAMTIGNSQKKNSIFNQRIILISCANCNLRHILGKNLPRSEWIGNDTGLLETGKIGFILGNVFFVLFSRKFPAAISKR